MTAGEVWALAVQWYPLAWRRLCQWGFPGDANDARQCLWVSLYCAFGSFDPAKGSPAAYARYAAAHTRQRLRADSGTLYVGMRGVELWRIAAQYGPDAAGLSARVADTLSWELAPRGSRAMDWPSGEPPDAGYDDEERLEDRVNARTMCDAADTMTGRERAALRSIANGSSHVEFGASLGVSRERARQIRDKAVRKLRQAMRG